METVQSYFGYKRPRGIFGKRNAKSHAVGIEIELEYIEALDNNLYPWSIVSDGSLKIQGKEFTVPVWNHEATQVLKFLFDHIKYKKSTSRCSTHVHIDVTEYTETQIKSIILHYIIFEKLLYNFSGKRWDNIFCVPVQTYITTIPEPLDNYSFRTLSSLFPKYAGIHLFPNNKFGTLEFRQMVGTTNADYINTWIQLLVTMVKQAVKVDYEVLKQMIFDMRTISSYWDFFNTTFQQYTIALNNETFKEDVEQGITIAKLSCTENRESSNKLLTLLTDSKHQGDFL